MRGPIAVRFGNVDLSWLSGMVTGGGLYYLLAMARKRRAPELRTTT